MIFHLKRAIQLVIEFEADAFYWLRALSDLSRVGLRHDDTDFVIKGPQSGLVIREVSQAD